MAKDKEYNYIARHASDYDGVAHEWMYEWRNPDYKGRTGKSFNTVRMSFEGDVCVSYSTDIAHRIEEDIIVYEDYKSVTTQKQLGAIRMARPGGVHMVVVPSINRYKGKEFYIKELTQCLYNMIEEQPKRNKYGAFSKAKEREEFTCYMFSLRTLEGTIPNTLEEMECAINECELALRERYEEQREKREALQAERVRIEQRSYEASYEEACQHITAEQWGIIDNVNTWNQYNKASELLKPYMSKRDREIYIESKILHHGNKPNQETLGCSFWAQVLFVLFENDSCEKVRTSGGVTMPTKHALVLAEMVRYSPDEVKGRHIGQFVVEAIDDTHVKVGCHVLEIAQLEKLYDYRASLLPEEK